ncbi:MAG: MSHA biogenesis protein MshL [Lentisphaeria bacterium]|jgi:MSHA biogenesis protein MshL
MKEKRKILKTLGYLLKSISAIAALGLLLSACAEVSQKQTSIEKTIDSVVEQQNERSKLHVPYVISNALLQGGGQGGLQGGLLGDQGKNNLAEDAKRKASRVREKRFNISVNQVPARTFFLSLVADSGVNVVAHPEVSGSISLELKNVTVDEVLNVTREVYGYEYQYKRGIYSIYPRKIRTEIFAINYLDVQRVGVTDTSVLIGKITSSSSGSSGGNSNSGNSGSSQNSSDSASLLGYLGNGEHSGGGEQISPGTRVQTLSKTDFWTGLNEALLAIVGGDGEGRMVMTNSQSGLAVVKALPRELSAVRDFLERSELSVKRQVVLETKILEVRLNDGYQTGVNWGAITGQLALSETNTLNGSLSDIVFGGKGNAESLVSSVLNVADISNLLSLLEQQGSVQVLSSPRISTVNNQKAVIRVGSDEFFVTGISNSTTSSASSIVNTPEVELDSFFSGISLDVTPQISADGEVILHVHPLVSNVQDQIKKIDVAGNSFSLPLALRDVRESDSIVKARSGQVVVLGGLMQESTSELDGKRPFIGDIPLLNIFFKTKQKTVVKTELVILMQPIVVEEGTWEEEISRGAGRIHTLSDEYRTR